MQIADLFDVTTRDQAVQELPDEDLVVAAVMMAQAHVADSLQRDWLGDDIAWLAVHARSAATVTAIVRQGAGPVKAEGLFKAFARVMQYRPPMASEYTRLTRTDGNKPIAAHIAEQPHGLAVLGELGRFEAHRMVEGIPGGANLGFVQEMLPYIDDVHVLERITECNRLISQQLVVARLWELGAHDIVLRMMNDDGDSTLTTRAARNAAKTLSQFHLKV